MHRPFTKKALDARSLHLARLTLTTILLVTVADFNGKLVAPKLKYWHNKQLLFLIKPRDYQ